MLPETKETISVEVVNKSEETTQSLGCVELSSNTKIENIFKNVQNILNEPDNVMDDIEISFEGKSEQEVNLKPYKDKSLKEIGINSISCDNKLKVMVPKQKMALCVQEVIEDDLLLGASASPTIADFFNRSEYFTEPVQSDEENRGNNQASSTTTIDTVNYVGLVNQAMTCYLNSLLQALFMTPEFRNALYNWEFDGQNEQRSIPFQLQKLFLKLQTSSKSAVETTDLTTSFGWQGSDAWQQHDIQELCRVMFDALEQKFKNTKQSNLINDLYEGKMLDYVRCLECCTEKSREDTFLDIPLPVRPFGNQVAYNSVEEALRAFVQPEILDGNNQYHCEKCNKKCNAHKGLKFTKFPYLLTLHLKRFDFDYNTLHRIKLNDKVVFSEILNLNSFIQGDKNEFDEQDEKEFITKYDDCCTTDSGSALEDEGCASTDASSTLNGQDVNCSESDEGIDVSSGNNHRIEAKGPYIYDLFSIMIHSGSATGGHYYAYIKDFERQQWYCFNDQSVSKITEDDIKKTYGGNPHRGYYSGAYSSSTNAYMLMYRQIDKERNTKAMSVNEFPNHIKNLLKQIKEKEEQDRKIKEKENDLIRIHIYCHHPIEKRMIDANLPVFIDSTLKETVTSFIQKSKLDGIVAKEDCRLVKYNKLQDCIECSYESDNLKFCDISTNDFTSNDWFLEIRKPNTEWEVYKPGAVNMKVFPINISTEDLEEPTFIRVNSNETVGELKRRLAVILDRPGETMEVVMERLAELTHFEKDDRIINFEQKNMEYKLYVTNHESSLDRSTCVWRLHKLIEKLRHVIVLKIYLPDVDASTLENLSIPSLDAASVVVNQNLDNILASGDRNSPQQIITNNCLDGFGDQSNSEDSSLSDSDRTLVGDVPGDCMGVSSNSSNSPADQHMVSPSDPAEDSYNYDVLGNPSEEMHWDDDESEEINNNFQFKVINVVEEESTDYCPFSRYCKLLVDKRITLERFKKHLEPYVKVPVEYFKIYRQFPSFSVPTEDEWSNLNDTLKCMKDWNCLSVRLGRVLGKDEHNFKIFLLRPNDNEPITPLFEHVIANGQTVGQVLKDVVHQAKKRHMLDFTYPKCRLREKSWKCAKKVYLENQIFGDDIPIIGSNPEIFFQELDDVEKVTSVNQMVFFVRRWRPSTLKLEPIQEIVVNTSAFDEIKSVVSQLSGIPLEHTEVALIKPTLPGHMHVLEIENDLDWKPNVTNFEDFYATDGNIFFYKDNRERLKELTTDERKEINLQENKRLGLLNNIKTYSPGKERALKIYLDPTPNNNNCNKKNENNTSVNFFPYY